MKKRDYKPKEENIKKLIVFLNKIENGREKNIRVNSKGK